MCGNSLVTLEVLGSVLDEDLPHVGAVMKGPLPLPNWNINSDLDGEEKEQVRDLLLEFRECFYPREMNSVVRT